MSEVNLTIVRSRIQKAAAVGIGTGLQEQVEFFADIDKLLKQHAKARHPELSSEGAFRKELENDDAFRSIVLKSRALQEELNYSDS